VNGFNYLELLHLAAPEAILTVAALLVLAADLLVMREQPIRSRQLIGSLIAALGCLAAIVALAVTHGVFNVPDGLGMLVSSPLTRLAKQVILVLAIFTLAFALEQRFTEHVGEFIALVLLSTLGMMFLVSSEDLLMLFVALELTSIPLYVLTAFNKRAPRPAEAAMKYFLFGGMAAAFLLFGFSLLYGMTGSTNLPQLAGALQDPPLDPLVVLALVMVMAGFGFKIAAVPFHLWAPDVYQGAPTPVAAYIASGSKVASFVILAKVLMLGFLGHTTEGSAAGADFRAGWLPLVAIVATLSMVLGNFTALAQTSVRRLLAYSAVAHAGYLLLALLANDRVGAASLLFYVTTYGVATIGAFAVVSAVEDAEGSDTLEAFAGLHRRAPLLALSLAVFLLSLAGIPPLAGFFGKFYVFAAALGAQQGNLGLLWLVILAIALSAVSLYYYLKVLKQAFVVPTDAGAPLLTVAPTLKWLALLLALVTVALGCFPGLLLDRISAAITGSGY
jgi:NADH-quinone oxidoreductase subunit N